VTYHVGSKDEAPGRTGFAHLFEHVLFQGSEHVGDEEHFAYVEQAGGSANGSTWFDKTMYYETLPSRYLELGLWLESDRMGYLLPALTQDAFDGQREVVKNERRWRVDNQPYGLWLERLLALSFPPEFPYHWPVIGFMRDLDAATLEDVRGFYSQFYGPQNATLCLAGSFDPAQARALIERYFGSLAGAPQKPPRPAPLPPLAGEQRDVLTDRVPAPRVFLAYHAPTLADPHVHAIDLMSDLLGSGRCARLYRALVQEQRVAQDVMSWYLAGESGGLVVAAATALPDVDATTIERAVDAEITRLVEGGPTDEEVDRVRTVTLARLVRDLETLDDRAERLADFATFHGSAARLNEEPARYAAVTRDEMRAQAERLLATPNRVALTFVPETAS
jgi:predicted Zn-dependent peptidase